MRSLASVPIKTSSPEIEKSLILMFLGFILMLVLEKSKILLKNET